jgi:hypothetical protein
MTDTSIMPSPLVVYVINAIETAGIVGNHAISDIKWPIIFEAIDYIKADKDKREELRLMESV